jgi:hypothetical protein
MQVSDYIPKTQAEKILLQKTDGYSEKQELFFNNVLLKVNLKI